MKWSKRTLGPGQRLDFVRPDTIVYVERIEDFPSPVGGFITLNNATYTIAAHIETDLKFKAPVSGYVILESAGNNFELKYTGAGAMFEDPAMGGSLVLDHLQLSTPNGAVFNLVGTGGNEVLLETATFYDVKSIGTIKDCDTTTNLLLILLWGQGLIIDGGYLFIAASTITQGLNEVGAVMLTVQGVINSIILNTGGFVTSGGNECILDIKSTSTIDVGSVSSNRFRTALGGGIYASGSLTHADPPLWFSGNVGQEISNSAITGEVFLEDNATDTIIPAVNAWVIINGNNAFTSSALERMVVNSEGHMYYSGLADTATLLDGNVYLDPVTAIKDCSTKFYHLEVEQTTVTFTNGTNLLNEIGTLREDGEQICFEDTPGALPAELRPDVMYYIVNKLTDSFQLAYTAGGAAVSFTDDGTPVNQYKIATPHGSTPITPIAKDAPRDLVAQALVPMSTGDELILCVSNKTDAVNIKVRNVYFRAKV